MSGHETRKGPYLSRAMILRAGIISRDLNSEVKKRSPKHDLSWMPVDGDSRSPFFEVPKDFGKKQN